MNIEWAQFSIFQFLLVFPRTIQFRYLHRLHCQLPEKLDAHASQKKGDPDLGRGSREQLHHRKLSGDGPRGCSRGRVELGDVGDQPDRDARGRDFGGDGGCLGAESERRLGDGGSRSRSSGSRKGRKRGRCRGLRPADALSNRSRRWNRSSSRRRSSNNDARPLLLLLLHRHRAASPGVEHG